MRSFEQVRAGIEALARDDELREACLKLVGVIEGGKGKHFGMWTYQVLGRWTGLSPSDELLHRCIAILTSTAQAKLLSRHFLIVDPNKPDDDGTEVADEEVANAYRTGEIYHPDTGAKIAEFESALIPYFELANDVAPANG